MEATDAAHRPLTVPHGIPPGWTVDTPRAFDVPALHALLVQHEEAARGGSSASLTTVSSEVVGPGSTTRRHSILRDPDGAVRAWATVQDRAAGRVIAAVIVEHGMAEADAAGLALYAWVADEAAALSRERGLTSSHVDAGAFADDPRQGRWLTTSGYTHVRTWWQMKRSVLAEEGAPGAFPEPHPDITVRQASEAPTGERPDAATLASVHAVLEESFADHFNYRTETLEEFTERLRQDPGHRWDHWWLAEMTTADGSVVPVGAVIAVVCPAAEGGCDSSYVDYVGVVRRARGRGVAKSMLHAAITEAARRGRDCITLEVDADSPTRADALYTSLGFVTSYSTQSWHLELPDL